MKKTVVINVVGLTPALIGTHTPFIDMWIKSGHLQTVAPILPAVTCSAQSTYLTGKMPQDHGIVANGWYFRDECEVKLWRQSNRLVQAPKIWEAAKEADPTFTCANMFWWYNMYSSVDFSVTPRPQYRADGLKLPDVYSAPAALRDELQRALGMFPLFKFWGPATSIESSQWIADASIYVDRHHNPTLTLIYLPHLDYNLQRIGVEGPRIEQDLREIDGVVRQLVEYYEGEGASVILLSEYGITPVNDPIHLNRLFRQKGWIATREEGGKELLDAGASKVFAVADHQIAHVYVQDESLLEEARKLLSETQGVELVLDRDQQQEYAIAHDRSGELVAVADGDSWFTYYYWLDDERAPDFARTVDIHRKPGYDPVEMFLDPELGVPELKVAARVLQKKLGFRYTMDVIPLDATLVKGSHGRLTEDPAHHPVFISKHPDSAESLTATDVYGKIWAHLTDK
ncbi:alkaline phosphatase family protein [Pontibacter sp. G13]|uniref:alkaline phosphatase family protein n=1 Tax=Pontibacter sp. G13 TaxID=3074898 RepID=UPI00288A3DE9|nr:alkaline phosphatase family protein [Pontibacter sp. G13]WNJ20610.1 alkaline phosphatase family protein [Pontibacter sp. G13]